MDEVVLNDQAQSQVEPATDQDNDITTWKKRLAGKDQALTATKKQLDEIKSEYDKVQAWKLQMEEASLTEFERAQNKIAKLEQELKTTRESETKSRLAKEFPTYVEWAEKSANLSDEERAREFEALMKSGGKQDDQFVDPNKPARAQATAGKNRSTTEIVKDIAALGNPWNE
jgi:DNA repair exonuclease SbcCD ATPase subunit